MAIPETSPASPRRTVLNREVLLDAALDLIDEQGLAALSLRTLAARLGVSAMGPYGHFESKQELLDALTGHALAALGTAPEAMGSWDERLAGAMQGLHDALAEHPGAIDLIMARPEADRLGEFRVGMLGVVAEAGLASEQQADALRILTSYVLGYVMLTRVREAGPDHGESADPFAFGLGLLIDALARTAAPR